MKQKINILATFLTCSLFIIYGCENDEGDNSVTDDTINEGTVTDIDGNVYSTVQIGEQEWITENLKTTTYNNGSSIEQVTGNNQWVNITTGAFCWYDNQYAVNTGNLCPDGWHVPTDQEWKELEMQLGMSQIDANDIGIRGNNEGSKLSGNAILWHNGEDDSVLTNNSEFGSSGFRAFPGGGRFGFGTFSDVGYGGNWWSASENSTFSAWYRNISYSKINVNRSDGTKNNGYCVRCLKD